MRFFVQKCERDRGLDCMRRALEVGLWGSYHTKTPVPPYSNTRNLWTYSQKMTIKDDFLIIWHWTEERFILGRILTNTPEEFNPVHPWTDISDEPVWGLGKIDWYTPYIRNWANYGLKLSDFTGYITMTTPNLEEKLDRHLTYKRVLEQIVQEESIKLAS